MTVLGAKMLTGKAFKTYSGIVHYLVSGHGYSAFCGAGKNQTGSRIGSIFMVTNEKVNCKKCIKMMGETG